MLIPIKERAGLKQQSGSAIITPSLKNRIKIYRKEERIQSRPFLNNNLGDKDPLNISQNFIFKKRKTNVNKHVFPSEPLHKKQPQKLVNKTVSRVNFTSQKNVTKFKIKKAHECIQNVNKTKNVLESQIMKLLKQTSFNYYISEVVNDIQSKYHRHYTNAREQDVVDSNQSIFIVHLMLIMQVMHMYQHVYIPKFIDSHTNQILKPSSQIKKILVFDLDETLVYTFPKHNNQSNKQFEEQSYSQSQYNECPPNQREIIIKGINGADKTLVVAIRPFALNVLKRLQKYFMIGIFTASQQKYARQIIKVLDPESKIFSFAYYRQHCHVLKQYYCKTQNKYQQEFIYEADRSKQPNLSMEKFQFVKDLRVMPQFNANSTILVDNSPISYLYQKQNGVPIVPFYGSRDDDQMLKLEKFLQQKQQAQKIQIMTKMFKAKQQLRMSEKLQDSIS